MNELITKPDLSAIVMRTNPNTFGLQTLTQADLANIAENMSEIDRATLSFGKSQSQYMDRIMTVSNHEPMRNLRQILAEIERIRGALKEAEIGLRRQVLKHKQKTSELTKATDEDSITVLQIDLDEIEGNVASSRLYFEGALKQLYAYQAAYDEIRKTYGIDQWDEKDFEAAEERHHIMKAFEQASAVFQATGTIDAGNHEYFRQIGVHPLTAQVDLAVYFTNLNKQIEAGQVPDITSFNQFLYDMAERHKGCSQKMIEAKGMLSGAFDKAMYRSNKADTGV